MNKATSERRECYVISKTIQCINISFNDGTRATLSTYYLSIHFFIYLYIYLYVRLLDMGVKIGSWWKAWSWIVAPNQGIHYSLFFKRSELNRLLPSVRPFLGSLVKDTEHLSIRPFFLTPFTQSSPSYAILVGQKVLIVTCLVGERIDRHFFFHKEGIFFLVLTS